MQLDIQIFKELGGRALHTEDMTGEIRCTHEQNKLAFLSMCRIPRAR
jgi:hypothetical protein